MTTLIDFTEAAMSRELAGQATGDPADAVRLSGQLAAVYDLMSDGGWWTLAELAGRVNASTQSVSARLRDLRKPFAGSHTVQREKIGGGLFRYRMTH